MNEKKIWDIAVKDLHIKEDLSYLVELFTDLLDQYGDSCCVEKWDDDGAGEFCITYQREETDQEMSSRLKREEDMQKVRDDYDYKIYEKLKKKFETS